ncbi:MAG: response regulator [Desulfovibrionaceae bacterium]
MSDKRILLVDDESGIRTVVGLTLRDQGHDVRTAGDGQEALDIFNAFAPQVVITDIKMPGMSGVELLDRIKAVSPETEVIMVTGHGDMDLAVKSLRRAAADFLTKPVSDEALEVALDRAFERIELRAKLREHTENLERLVRDKTRELLEAERMAAVGQTVTDLAHAIKNVASGLEGGLFVLGKGIELDERDYLHQGWDMVKGNVQRVRNLSLDLLNYARFARIQPQPCDPDEPARQALEALRDRAQALGAPLATELGAGPEAVLLDAAAVERALLNLLVNALDAREATGQGTITLGTRRLPEGGVEYAVSDTCGGMAGDAADQAFNAFFTTKPTGTGIGLMTVRKIAEQHGGEVLLDAQHRTDTGVGVRVRLILPAH